MLVVPRGECVHLDVIVTVARVSMVSVLRQLALTGSLKQTRLLQEIVVALDVRNALPASHAQLLLNALAFVLRVCAELPVAPTAFKMVLSRTLIAVHPLPLVLFADQEIVAQLTVLASATVVWMDSAQH